MFYIINLAMGNASTLKIYCYTDMTTTVIRPNIK